MFIKWNYKINLQFKKTYILNQTLSITTARKKNSKMFWYDKMKLQKIIK